MNQSWHCDYTYQTVTGSLDSYPTPLSSDCFVTASSSNSSSCGSSTTTPCYNEISYLDFLIPQLVVIFCLSVLAFGFFLRPPRKV